MYINMCEYVCIYIYIHICVYHIYIHTSIDVFYTNICIMCVYIYVLYIYIHALICIYIYIHNIYMVAYKVCKPRNRWNSWPHTFGSHHGWAPRRRLDPQFTEVVW